jgi:hypothetical protein
MAIKRATLRRDQQQARLSESAKDGKRLFLRT